MTPHDGGVMSFLWAINIAAWGAVMLYMAPDAWRASFRKSHQFDPLRMAFFATAFLLMCMPMRWLFAPDNTALWALLYGLSAADAIYVIIVARAIGRGPSNGS